MLFLARKARPADLKKEERMNEYNIDTQDGMRRAVEWQTNMCDLLGEGGKWGVPVTGEIYTVYKSKKLATVEGIEMLEDSEYAQENSRRIRQVFEAMGWKVE